jgi:hypothetical protein
MVSLLKVNTLGEEINKTENRKQKWKRKRKKKKKNLKRLMRKCNR